MRWPLVEAILLIGFSIPLWADRVEGFPAPADATQVRVVAEQFAWNIHYPGPDGVFGRTDVKLIDLQANPLGLDREDPAAKDDVTTINQLHLPVGRPVLIQLSSKDVIHSFALQEMRVKQDVIPGTMIPVWFVPTVTSEEMQQRKGNPEWSYEISCAQLCGLGHYRMRGYMTIHTRRGLPEVDGRAAGRARRGVGRRGLEVAASSPDGRRARCAATPAASRGRPRPASRLSGRRRPAAP